MATLPLCLRSTRMSKITSSKLEKVLIVYKTKRTLTRSKPSISARLIPMAKIWLSVGTHSVLRRAKSLAYLDQMVPESPPPSI